MSLAGDDQAGRAAGVCAALAAHSRVEGDGLEQAGIHLPLVFGSLGFDADTDGVLIVPRRVEVSWRGHVWLVDQEVDGAAEGPLAPCDSAGVPSPGRVRVTAGSVSDSDYLERLSRLIVDLREGRARKVVIARDVIAQAERPVHPAWLAERLHEAYPTCWTYAIDGLVGATPEMLAEVHDGRVHVRVLAGTAGRDEGEQLLASRKDRLEHDIAVASVRESLAPLATNLSVPDQPQVLTLPNVTHLSSTIRGDVSVTSLQAAGALHPTAAVCGSPTRVAKRMIRALEGGSRGRYAAPVGWMDARGNGQWGIALRCGQIDPKDPRRVRVIAGGGIMPDSDPTRELLETEAKMRPVLAALGVPDHG